MERIISVWSDRNIWEHFWRWSNLIGPTGFLSICQIVVPWVPLFCILLTSTITKRAVPLNWVVRYRSFGQVEFRKFQETGIFVAYKAPLINYIYGGGWGIQFSKGVENWRVQFSLGKYNFYFCVFTVMETHDWNTISHSLTHSCPWMPSSM